MFGQQMGHGANGFHESRLAPGLRYSVSESATRLQTAEHSTPSSHMGTVSAQLESLPLHITYGLFAPRHSLDRFPSCPCTTNTISFFTSLFCVLSRFLGPKNEISVELAGLPCGIVCLPKCNARCTSETRSSSRNFAADAQMCSMSSNSSKIIPR